MEAALLILLITVAGSSAMRIFQHCEISRCDSYFSPQQFRASMRNFPQSASELKEICPPFLQTIDCFSELVIECTGESLENLASSENATVAQFSTMIKNIMSLVRDVCDEESQFGKDFRDSSTCIRKMIANGNTDCRKKGNKLYDIFKFPDDAEDLDEELTPLELDKLIAESHCLTQAFEVACILKDLQKDCGEVAKNVLLQVVKRPQMLRMGFCSEEDLLTLRGQFLDFLEEQGEEREFLSSVFEFRRRRK